MNDLTRPAGRFLAVLCLTALAGLAFWGYLRTGPTTSDDLVYEQAVATGRLGFISSELATKSGRFHHYLHVGLTSLPYHLDGWPARKALGLAATLAGVAALALLAARLSGTAALGILTAALALSLSQDNWHHNILTAYPLVFDSGLLWLLAAGYALLRHGETDRGRWLILANIAMFLAFCHFEAFVAYLPILAGVVWLTGRGGPGARLRTLGAAFVAVPVYLAVYLGYRLAHPSQYAGNALDISSPWRIVETALAYSASALPLGAFHLNLDSINRFPVATSRYILSFAQYLGDLAANWALLSPAWVAIGLLAGGLTYACLRRADGGLRPGLPVLLLALYAVVCPNLLIALTPKYQEPALSGDSWYVTSTFSFYALAVLFALLGLTLAGRSPRPLRRPLAVVLGLLVGLTALVNASVNASVLTGKVASAARWRLADLAVRSPALAAVPGGAILLAPDLFTPVATELVQPDYWGDYFAQKTGRHFHVVARLDPATTPETTPVLPLFVLRRLSAPTDPATALALARVSRLGPPAADPYARDPDAPTLLADQVEVAVDATNRLLDLLYRDHDGFTVVPATVGGRRGLSETHLAGQGIALASLALFPARTLATGATAPVLLRFGQGFGAPERAVTGDMVWAGGAGEILLDNTSPTPARVRLTATLVALTPVRLAVAGAGLQSVLASDGPATPIALDLALPAGRSALAMTVEGPGDGPEKRFGLLGAALTPLSTAP
ncbi:MAG: hypothetical protein ACLGQH_07715 [Acidobacteriota bacterium]